MSVAYCQGTKHFPTFMYFMFHINALIIKLNLIKLDNDTYNILLLILYLIRVITFL